MWWGLEVDPKNVGAPCTWHPTLTTLTQGLPVRYSRRCVPVLLHWSPASSRPWHPYNTAASAHVPRQTTRACHSGDTRWHVTSCQPLSSTVSRHSWWHVCGPCHGRRLLTRNRRCWPSCTAESTASRARSFSSSRTHWGCAALGRQPWNRHNICACRVHQAALRDAASWRHPAKWRRQRSLFCCVSSPLRSVSWAPLGRVSPRQLRPACTCCSAPRCLHHRPVSPRGLQTPDCRMMSTDVCRLPVSCLA